MRRLDFATCHEVDDQLIEEAFTPAQALGDPEPRQRVFELLDRMREVARPRQGAFRVLFVFAKLADCDWLEGDLEVRLKREAAGTTVELLCDDGLSLSRLHTAMHFVAPFDEFAMFIDYRVALLTPLAVSSREPGKIVWLRSNRRASDAGAARPALDAAVHSQTRAGEAIQRQATTKIAAVRIPPEAFREDRDESRATDRAPARDQPPTSAVRGKRSPDEIDEGWE